jgi:hypothetical protein
MRVNSNFLLYGLVAAAVALILAGIFHSGSELWTGAETGANPFAYSLEAMSAVDPSLLQFREERRLDVDLAAVHAVAAGPGGRIYVSGERELLVMDDNGVRRRLDLPESGYCLAVAPTGRVFIGLLNRVGVVDADGPAVELWPPLNGQARITSLTVAEESLFVADAGNRMVVRYSLAGEILGRIGAADPAAGVDGFHIPSPYFDVCVGHDGSLWAVNPGRHRLENYSADGRLRSVWGEPSGEVSGFCGCCNPTHLAIGRDGTFVTSEKGVPRVKVYSPAGRLEAVVAGPDQFAEGTVGLDLAVDESGRILVLDPVAGAVRIFVRKRS